MNNLPSLKLKPGKEIPILAGHPWIFSKAIQENNLALPPGSLIQLFSDRGQFLGIGSFNGRNSIAVRILTRQEEDIDLPFFKRQLTKLAKRKKLFLPEKTTGYRLVNADSDGLPGLILDVYEDTFVFQIHTAGMDQFRELIIRALNETFQPKVIVERSDVLARKQEGLMELPVKIHQGELPDLPIFSEAGLKFYADIENGQKTGFFLDQRKARLKVQKLAKNKKILDLFCYSGSFTVHAAQGGAKEITAVDISKKALELAQKNLELNNFPLSSPSKINLVEADIFNYLNSQKEGDYDLVLCDPPAFAKSNHALPQALRAYTNLNSQCLSLLPKDGILVTSSCSGRVTESDFKEMLKIAAFKARRDVQLLDFLTHSEDHTEKLSFPEGRYLKTAILRVLEKF